MKKKFRYKRDFVASVQHLSAIGYEYPNKPPKEDGRATRIYNDCRRNQQLLARHGGLEWLEQIGYKTRLSKCSKKSLGRDTKKNRKRMSKPSVKRATPSNVKWLPRDEWENQTQKFYNSQEWKELRYEVLREGAGACTCCGARASDGLRIHVDHIKPRSKYPELQLSKSNLQILCEDCNFGKSNYYDDDWRVKMQDY